MYTDATVIEARLSELNSYRDLKERDRTIAAKILKTIAEMGNEATFSAMRNKHVAGIDTFRVFLKWLFNRKLLDKKQVKERKIGRHRWGRPHTNYKLTKEGEEALNYLKIPEYKCVKFHAYSYEEEKLVLMITQKTRNGDYRAKNLDTDEIVHLIESVGRETWLFKMATSPLLMNDEKRLEIESSSKKVNPVLSNVIQKMLDYSKKALLGEVSEAETVEEAPTTKLMRDEIFFGIFPFSDFCLSLGLTKGISLEQQAAINAYNRYWRKIWKNRAKKKEVLQIFEKVSDSTPCKKWISQRLEEYPNYFMPSPLWVKLDFNVPRKWVGEVIFPYNLILVEPRFAQILPRVKHHFSIMEYEGESIVGGLERGTIFTDDETNYRLKKRFAGFLSTLWRFQNDGDFYEAWRVIRESPTSRNLDYKELVVFKPLEAAFHRYIKTSFAIDDLWKAYLQIFSNLGKGKEPVKTFNAIADEIANGKYTLKRRPRD